MAKRRTKKANAKKRSIKEILVMMGILFSGILFLIKIITGGVGWFEVFAPVVVAFFIVFLLSVLKSVFSKI